MKMDDVLIVAIPKTVASMLNATLILKHAFVNKDSWVTPNNSVCRPLDQPSAVRDVDPIVIVHMEHLTNVFAM